MIEPLIIYDLKINQKTNAKPSHFLIQILIANGNYIQFSKEIF